ncbi:MAG: hypothetical protein FJ284_13865 [Planctomycetes bacterium]|nr:hypothetical protein [Planctomycetota bacterium]
MFVSAAGRIAFAHYPKTAGCSILEWFRGRFPDAAYVQPGNCHMPVRASLERLGLVPARGRRPRIVRACLRIVERVAPRLVVNARPCDLRVIGVLREPFEMLVSLYEYWRRYEFREEPDAELIRTARTGTFRDFLRAAVGTGHLANYETYFDVGGPAWQSTRLIDFQSLESGLAEVCGEFGVEPPTGLGRRNAAPQRGRDVGAYLAEAGGLVFDVRNHFRWYYDEASRIMRRGRRVARQRAA